MLKWPFRLPRTLAASSVEPQRETSSQTSSQTSPRGNDLTVAAEYRLHSQQQEINQDGESSDDQHPRGDFVSVVAAIDPLVNQGANILHANPWRNRRDAD